MRLIQRVMPKQIAADVTMTAAGALGLDLTGMSEAELLRLAQAVAVERDDLKDYSDEDLATLAAWTDAEIRRRAESRNGTGAPGPARKGAPSSPAGPRTANGGLPREMAEAEALAEIVAEMQNGPRA